MGKLNILTITLSPAVDICYYLEKIELGNAVRTKNPLKSAGGKGLNVSRVIRLLGENVIASGFIGGSNGIFIHHELEKLDIGNQFVNIKGETRQCLAFIDEMGNQTEILEEGPFVTEEEQEKIKKYLLENMSDVKIIVMSGSLPKGVSAELYRWIISKAKHKGIKVILDTSGKTLNDCLSCGPFMVKPNREELAQIFNKTSLNEDEVWNAMEQIQKKIIPLVVVSDGKNGSYVLFEEKRYKVSTPNISAVSAVGSGDSFVAGVATGLARCYSIEQALALGSACGAANAMEKRTGFIQPENVQELLKKITVKRLL